MTQRQPFNPDRRAVQSPANALLRDVRAELAMLETSPVVLTGVASDLARARRQLALAEAAAAQCNGTLATHHAYLAAQIARLAKAAAANNASGEDPGVDPDGDGRPERSAACGGANASKESATRPLQKR